MGSPRPAKTPRGRVLWLDLAQAHPCRPAAAMVVRMLARAGHGAAR
jgi:hypothetical protein